MQINKLLANSENYTRGRTRSVKYIVVHYTANNGDTAKGNCNYFATSGRNASAHYFVDENSIYQSVEDSDTAWSVGATSYTHADCRNNNSISVEMCSRKDTSGSYYIKDETVNNTVELVKELMIRHNVPIANVIRHYDVTGKKCPEPFVRDKVQWTAFKKRLEEEEMVEQAQIKINGTVYAVDRILKDGVNYVKVRDFEKAGFVISNEGNMAVITTK